MISLADVMTGYDTECSGAYGVNYFYHVNPHFSVGATVGAEQIEAKKEGMKTATSTYLTVMPAVKVHYIKKDHFGLYSKAAVGVAFDLEHDPEFQTKNNTYVGVQVSALGLEAGGETMKGFVEVGYGYEGLAMAGIRFSF